LSGPLVPFIKEYTGVDKAQYSYEEYNETFCSQIHGGIRSFNEAYFKDETAADGASLDDKL